ncbi:hypothetical protein EV421DRAFT_1130809 [Armillaria borealis]|uniref:F-box domain-containing protein n=1 Tax=Armillaria borealis TaxID=47425 RepID=A0AA39J5U9_9AGAR|nr:hypothetical protein EV421DRAFT_1130809 [Armillaria borealis]
MSSSFPQCGYNGQDRLPLSFEAANLTASRMDELLKSNNPPLQAERVQLESVIGDGHGLLAGLQERIAQTRAALEVLLDEERRVERTIESCKTIVRPIRRIPEDIVREIFLTCFGIEGEGKDSLDRNFAPLILSQVCRDWRSIALSTSRLWSSIRLDFDQYRNELACQYLLQTYLLRSAAHDITLSIHSTRDISKSHLIPALLLSAPRWTNLSMTFPYNSLFAFSAARGSLHRLNRLSIQFIGDVPGLPVGLAKPIFDAFEYAPLLRSFSLKGAYRAIQQINVPWSQLTDYAGHDLTSSYIDILKHAPDMESASLQCDEDSEDDYGVVRPSTHQCLRVLHVHEVEETPDSFVPSEGGIIRVLSHIEVPTLESLSMTYAHPFIQLPTSLRGSTAGNLKSLSIAAPFLISAGVQADLISLLKTTASLSSLSVPYALVPAEDHFDLENELLLYLNANINPDAVPRLTSLVIRLTNAVPHLLPSFVDMVQSRRHVTPTRAALQTLHLSVPLAIPLGLDPDVAARWKELCDEGLVMYGME